MIAESRLLTVAMVLIVVSLSACSADPGSPATTPAPAVTVTAPGPTVTTTATASPMPNAGVLTAGSLTSFKNQLVDEGLPCDDWTVVSKATLGKCDDLNILTVQEPGENGQKLYQLSLAGSWEALRIAERQDIALLVGTNCFVRLALQDAETLQERVGGVILN